MEITVSSRNLELSDSLLSTTRRKISRLDRFNGGIARAEVHFYEERNPRITDREVCEVRIEGGGQHIRCKVAAPDSFAAVDKAVAKLEHQLQKLKKHPGSRVHAKV